jgi:hypothetical protein
MRVRGIHGAVASSEIMFAEDEMMSEEQGVQLPFLCE